MKKVPFGLCGEGEGGWWSYEVSDGYGVGLWKFVRKEQNTFLCSLSFVMGNGRVKFWTDKWYRDEPWCVSFPSLYAIAISKEEWVEDL